MTRSMKIQKNRSLLNLGVQPLLGIHEALGICFPVKRAM